MSRRGRKRKEEDEDEKVAEMEQDNLSSIEMKEEIDTIWEIPQIFQFLHLTKESLNVPQFSMYEMERMLLIPRASKQLANIMTCLLSSPITKAKLRKVPPMPYEFWTNILAHKMENWFKVYHAKHKDATKVLETIGIEPEFWNIFPDATSLDGKDFENLSFKQRVWLLKTVCDTIMHTRRTVQEDLAKQPWEDQFETVLGTDRYGARYIYFPQFIPNDLRIYRHCLDNKILSTVKPLKLRQGMEAREIVGARLNRYRQRKCQSHCGLSDRRSIRRENKMNEKDNKDVNSCKSSNSATGSFTSEDTSLSSSSTCSNNNSISLDVINSKKRQRTSSKTSEENTLPNVRTSGHIFDKSIEDESLQMFKGFAVKDNIKDSNNYSIGIINVMLDNLKSQIDKEKKTESSDSNESQGSLVDSCKNTIDFRNEVSVVERDESERSNDNLSSSSKTDDEKLNEIISAEYSKLPESIYSKCVDDNISDNSSTTTCKSDDEKLSETITGGSVSTNNSAKGVTFNGSLRECSNDSVTLSEEVVKCEHFGKVQVPPRAMRTRSNDSSGERTLRKRAKLRSRYRTVQYDGKDRAEMDEKDFEDEKMDKKDDPTSDVQLQEALSAVNNYINGYDADYDLRRSKECKQDECKLQHFNKILTDLSVSDFQLVVDSVEALRDLIASFSGNNSESDNMIKAEAIPPCELKLVTKLTELLSSLEMMETTLKDAMRKAKSKLQREWSNFKEGSVEDQDSSGESGLSSNWWVLGSQGRDSLSATGDATLQTLSQFALSSSGAQNTQQQPQPVESEHKHAADKSNEQSCHESQECASDEQQNGNNEKQSDVKDAPPKGNQVKEGEERREHKQRGQNKNTSNEGAEQQTRRVLRARGVSSYTEQLYSDDESDENELDGWTDIEAVYAAPGAQVDTSAANATPKVGHADDWSEEEEDSDQDWILPSSRKRKNKRSTTNRRLKSFQNKVQIIKENTSESNATPDNVLQSVNAKIGQDKHKTKFKNNSEIKKFEKTSTANSTQSSTVPTVTSMTNNPKRPVQSSADSSAICKIESVGSVHSELNIEDDMVYESGSTVHYQQNNYRPTTTQQDYYYVVSQNPGITQGIIQQPIMQQTGTIVQQIASPQLQHGYYVQSVTQQNYVMQAPFLPVAQQQQQPVFSQQNQQLIATTQPYINNAGYVIATTQPQAGYVVASGTMANPQNPLLCTPRQQNRCNQNNRQSIRGKAPGRGGASQRFANPAAVKSQVPRQRAPNSQKAVTRQRTPQISKTENSSQKTTSVIMLSDSDDEIEMIITEKTAITNTNTEKKTSSDRATQNVAQPKQKPTVTSNIAINESSKGIISPQIIQRMSQGGISITPIKSTPSPSTSNGNTQLVVVVNETGSHYALALPNGSKLILTPEQVAQIRASNGGKLIL